MKDVSEPKTFEDGREQQFELMMERIAALQAKYGGVRGELLAKVWTELMETRPTRSSAPAAAATARPAAPAKTSTPPAPPAKPEAARASAKVLPSCRVCGRGMKPAGGGTLVCERGHTRVVA